MDNACSTWSDQAKAINVRHHLQLYQMSEHSLVYIIHHVVSSSLPLQLARTRLL